MWSKKQPSGLRVRVRALLHGVRFGRPATGASYLHALEQHPGRSNLGGPCNLSCHYGIPNKNTSLTQNRTLAPPLGRMKANRRAPGDHHYGTTLGSNFGFRV